MSIAAADIAFGKTYYVNLYENPRAPVTFGGNFHESFDEAVVAARHELSVEPETRLLQILEVTAIKGLEPLEMYP